MAGILNQYDSSGIHRPVNYHTQKCTSAKQNYAMYNQELLPIAETMRSWREYLEGANYMISIQCNRKIHEYLWTLQVLSRRQASWVQILSSYDSLIEQLEGKKNPANAPSR
jgi:hypothetical protein